MRHPLKGFPRKRRERNVQESPLIYWGEYVKKEYDDYREFIVKLEIPEYAKRSSSTSNKCRCSEAKVLEIRDILRDEKLSEITNTNKTECVYRVGETVYPDSFDECRWNECSNGIHFFMSEEEAVNY